MFQNVTLTSHSTRFQNFLNFPLGGFHQNMFFENLFFRILTIYFFQNFKFTVVAHDEIKKPQVSGKQATVEKMHRNLGLTCSSSAYMGYFWPCSVQSHIGIFRCTFDFFSKYDLQNTSTLMILLQPTFCRCSL